MFKQEKSNRPSQCFCVHNCRNGCELKKGYARIHEKIDALEDIIKRRIKSNKIEPKNIINDLN